MNTPNPPNRWLEVPNSVSDCRYGGGGGMARRRGAAALESGGRGELPHHEPPVGGERLLGDTEKEALRRLMWRLARFAGVKIHTYAIMDNHFQVLARVPSHDPFVAQFAGPGGKARLLEHLRLLYSGN